MPQIIFGDEIKVVSNTYAQHIVAAPILVARTLQRFLIRAVSLNLFGSSVLRIRSAHIHKTSIVQLQGVFFHWYPPKKLKYGKPRLGESTLT